MPTNVAVHTISFRGKAGAIFVTLCCAVISFVVGYITHSWSSEGSRHEGLWETCNCTIIQSEDGKYWHCIEFSQCIHNTLYTTRRCAAAVAAEYTALQSNKWSRYDESKAFMFCECLLCRPHLALLVRPSVRPMRPIFSKKAIRRNC